jgi:hypothetical protein
MKILIACEYSGIVRDAFIKKGHDAISCDTLPSESDFGTHYQCDVNNILMDGWDMMIAFPPCTHIARSGAKWFPEKQKDFRQQKAIVFFLRLALAPIAKIVIENPIGIMSSLFRKPDQIIQPWQFGHGETKATCLWLKGVPKLEPTNIVTGRKKKIHMMPQSKNRSKLRSKTYQGIADAMAEQWG